MMMAYVRVVGNGTQEYPSAQDEKEEERAVDFALIFAGRGCLSGKSSKIVPAATIIHGGRIEKINNRN